jgi:hypothetical protein
MTVLSGLRLHPVFAGRLRARRPEAFQRLAEFARAGVAFALIARMSILRTMSLIAGGALVALGGSALALFI